MGTAIAASRRAGGRSAGTRLSMVLVALAVTGCPSPPVIAPPAPAASAAVTAAPAPVGALGEPVLEGEPRLPVTAAVLSPGGSRMAIRLGRSTVEVWDVAKGTRLAAKELASPEGDMVFAPGASSLQIGSLMLEWTATPEPNVPVPARRAATAADLPAADKWARALGGTATLDGDKIVVRAAPPASPATGAAPPTTFLASPTGHSIAAVIDRDKVSVFSLERAASWQATPFKTGFSSRGTGAPGLIDIRLGPRPDRAVLVSWSLAGVQERGEGRLIELATGKVIASLGAMCPPYEVQWSGSGNALYHRGCYFDRPHLVETESGRDMALPDGEFVAMDAQARTLVVERGSLRVVEREGERELLALVSPVVHGARLLRGGSRLLVTTAQSVDLWSVDRGERSFSTRLPFLALRAVDRSEQLAVFAAASGFHLLDLRDASFRGPLGEGVVVAASGDAVLLSVNKHLHLRDLDGKLLFDTELTIGGKTAVVARAALARDRVYVVTTAGDLVVLGAKDGKITASRPRLWRHEVSGLAASPDGARVAVSGTVDDGTATEVYTSDLRRAAGFQPEGRLFDWTDDSASIVTADWGRLITRHAKDGSVASERTLPRKIEARLALQMALRGPVDASALELATEGLPAGGRLLALSPDSGLRAFALGPPGQAAPPQEGIRLLAKDGRVLRVVSRRLGTLEGWAVLDPTGLYDASPSLLPVVRARAPDGSIGAPLASALAPRLLAQIWSGSR